MWQWSEYFSRVPACSRVSLGEGNTPVVRSQRIGPAMGLDQLYFKLEIANPSGSYKDRFASAAISQMVADGKKQILATSSGNTGAALAAYAAAAGLSCEIAIVETAPDGKLKQMAAYGANLFKVKGFGLDAEVTRRVMADLLQRAQDPKSQLQISAYAYSPDGMRGVQTIGYELAQQCPQQEWNHVFVPAGGGGLILAVARGFEQMVQHGKISASPKIQCVQPTGNDTIATPLASGQRRARAVACTTAISGLQVAGVLDGDDVITACRVSGGTGHIVQDAEVWEAQMRLAREEGIFCEPAGAVALAAALNAAATGVIAKSDCICCLVTGSGFKDEASLNRMLDGWECPVVA
jgi:threonine synthase